MLWNYSHAFNASGTSWKKMSQPSHHITLETRFVFYKIWLNLQYKTRSWGRHPAKISCATELCIFTSWLQIKCCHFKYIHPSRRAEAFPPLNLKQNFLWVKKKKNNILHEWFPGNPKKDLCMSISFREHDRSRCPWGQSHPSNTEKSSLNLQRFLWRREKCVSQFHLRSLHKKNAGRIQSFSIPQALVLKNMPSFLSRFTDWNFKKDSFSRNSIWAGLEEIFTLKQIHVAMEIFVI